MLPFDNAARFELYTPNLTTADAGGKFGRRRVTRFEFKAAYGLQHVNPSKASLSGASGW